ncbi:MAG: hypothetical protein ACTSQB_03105 [Candidatus Heimdallarchaeota archaeon]
MQITITTSGPTMKCPKCQSVKVEKIISNKTPVLEYTCSGMHTRINKTVVHREFKCKDCLHKWK